MIENRDDHEVYTDDLKARVETAFHTASQVSKLKSVLTRIKSEAKNMRELFLTDPDQAEIQEQLRNLDVTMQKAHLCITKNLEAYQDSKWSELIEEEQGE